MESSSRQRYLLLVEDDPISRKMGELRLEKLGFRVDVACDGFEAIELLQKNPYDLVLMDCHLPGMDGYEASMAIRSSDSGVLDPKVPIVALSASSICDLEKCQAARMNDFLSKLAPMNELGAKIDYWIERSQKQKNVEFSRGSRAEESIPSTQDDPGMGPTSIQHKDGDAQDAGAVIFKESELLARLMDDRNLEKVFLDAFLVDIPRQMTALKFEINAGSADNALRLAHGMKGTSANLAAYSLAEAFEVAVGFAKQGDLPGMAGSIAAIEREFERFDRTIRGLEWMTVKEVTH